MIISPNPFQNLMGWGKVYNAGGGVTGGGVGDTLYFNESSSVNGENGFFALWETIRLNLLTPLNLVWTGGTITLQMINYRIDGSNWDTTREGSPKHKTIYFDSGQLMQNGTPQFRGWENLILRNIKRQKSSAISGNEGDGFSFLNCNGVWVDHCHIDGEGTGNSTNALIQDGGLDFTVKCDNITVSNCIIEGLDKTVLIGSSDASTDDEGFNNVTFYGNNFERCRVRSPYGRYGKIHLFNNLWDWPQVPDFYSILHQLGIKAQIVTEKNDFKKFNGGFRDSDETLQAGGILAIDNLIGQTLLSSPNTSGIRPENVVWFNPLPIHYTYTAISKNDVEDNVRQYAGSKFHLLGDGPFNLILSSNDTNLGVVARNPASGAITAGGVVTLTATPIGEAIFQGWYRNSVTLANRISTSNPFVLTMNQDENIVGSFVLPSTPGRKGFAKKRN